jgi:hypothetical protein
MNLHAPTIQPRGKLRDYLQTIHDAQEKERNSRRVPDDLSVHSEEGRKLNLIKAQVFRKNGKELIPAYLKKDFPTQKGKLAKEWALSLNKHGDRPTAEGF